MVIRPLIKFPNLTVIGTGLYQPTVPYILTIMVSVVVDVVGYFNGTDRVWVAEETVTTPYTIVFVIVCMIITHPAILVPFLVTEPIQPQMNHLTLLMANQRHVPNPSQRTRTRMGYTWSHTHHTQIHTPGWRYLR